MLHVCQSEKTNSALTFSYNDISIYLNIVKKQFKHQTFFYFESIIQSQIIIKYMIDMSNPQKYYRL